MTILGIIASYFIARVLVGLKGASWQRKERKELAKAIRYLISANRASQRLRQV